jgi:hypothetical protein
MAKKLLDIPILRATVSEDPESDVELKAVALVDNPAIQANFLTFSDEPALRIKFTADDERHIVTGPLMIANYPIYRRIQGKEFYLIYEADTIYKMVQKFFKKGYQDQVNFMHDGKIVEGVTLFESFIVDPSRGVLALEAFADAPAGSWFGSFYVENAEAWALIKDGTFKGFSIEGLFTLEGIDALPDVADDDLKLLEKVKKILRQKAKD